MDDLRNVRITLFILSNIRSQGYEPCGIGVAHGRNESVRDWLPQPALLTGNLGHVSFKVIRRGRAIYESFMKDYNEEIRTRIQK